VSFTKKTWFVFLDFIPLLYIYVNIPTIWAGSHCVHFYLTEIFFFVRKKVFLG